MRSHFKKYVMKLFVHQFSNFWEERDQKLAGVHFPIEFRKREKLVFLKTWFPHLDFNPILNTSPINVSFHFLFFHYTTLILLLLFNLNLRRCLIYLIDIDGLLFRISSKVLFQILVNLVSGFLWRALQLWKIHIQNYVFIYAIVKVVIAFLQNLNERLGQFLSFQALDRVTLGPL